MVIRLLLSLQTRRDIVPASLQFALQQHQAGKLAEAAGLYREILTSDPQDADAFHLLGVLMQQSQQSEIAIELIKRAIEINPRFAPYHNNLGNALAALGRRDGARSSFQCSIALTPNPETYINLATLDLGDGRIQEARAGFKAAQKMSPGEPASLLGLGQVALGQGQKAAARRWFQRALAFHPNYAPALNALGDLHLAEARQDEAEKCFIRATEACPSDVDGHLRLGNHYMRLERPAPAAISYRKASQLEPRNRALAILLGSAYLMEEDSEAAKATALRALALDPQHPACHLLLGNALVLGREYERAFACFERCLALDPSQHEALNGMGNACDLLGQYDRAAIAFEAALALRPETATYLLNLGVTRGRQNDSAAIALLEQAIALEPNNAGTHVALAETLLSFGDYARGFAEYGWRWRYLPFSRQHRQHTAPLWDGSTLAGRTILLHAEQGLGDTIQFVRFLPQVAKLGGTIILAVQRPLFRLFKSLPWHVICLGEHDNLPAFDIYCPLLSLPAALDTKLQSIPDPVDLTSGLNGSFGADTVRESNARMRVGLVWAGNPGHKRDALRSLPLAALLPLRRISRCSFVSLQKDVPPADRAVSEVFAMEHPLDFCQDLLDTAHVLQDLDLVLSVDTAVAHLAATLGRRVWLILPEAADWRWGKTEETTPWYPAMKLFRRLPGETSERLVERLARALYEISGAPVLR